MCAEAEAWFGCAHAFEHEIRLLTGRTHQIRAQLASMGAPLLGDEMYAALRDAGLLMFEGTAVEPEQDTAHLAEAEGSAGIGQWHANGESVGQDRGLAPMLPNGAVQDSSGAAEVPEWVERVRAVSWQEWPLGLQAARMTLHFPEDQGGSIRLDAGCPWWRKQLS